MRRINERVTEKNIKMKIKIEILKTQDITKTVDNLSLLSLPLSLRVCLLCLS